jgi:hypothetical protein
MKIYYVKSYILSTAPPYVLPCIVSNTQGQTDFKTKTAALRLMRKQETTAYIETIKKD